MWTSVHPSGSRAKLVHQIVTSLVDCMCQGIGTFTGKPYRTAKTPKAENKAMSWDTFFISFYVSILLRIS